MIRLIRVLVHQAVTLPGDVVVSVHNREDRVPDEDQQEQEPVSQIAGRLTAHVGLDEGGESYDCGRLRDVS